MVSSLAILLRQRDVLSNGKDTCSFALLWYSIMYTRHRGEASIHENIPTVLWLIPSQWPSTAYFLNLRLQTNARGRRVSPLVVVGGARYVHII